MENHHTSIWEDTINASSFSQLAENVETDVAIIGGGITGLTAGYFLKKAGKKVTILESHYIGAGTSGHTTAHLTTEYDHDYYILEKAYGDEICKLVAQSLKESIDLVSDIVSELNIECSFQRLPGYLYAEYEDGISTIEQEYRTVKRLGLYDAEIVDHIPLPFPTQKGYMIKNQAQMQPMAYLLALAHYIQGDGSHVFEHTRVKNYENGKQPLVSTEFGEVRSQTLILATHTPLGRSFLHALVAPYRSYVCAFTIKNNSLPEALFWDTEEPYNYIRLQKTPLGPMVIVGGKDKKVGHGNEKESFSELETYVRKRFEIDKIHYLWSAQFYDPVDHLPFIGHLPLSSNVYVATGYSGDGMTLGSLAGYMISNQIIGKATQYDKIYQPARIKPQGIQHFIKENIDVAKNFISDRIAFNTSHKSLVELNKGEGMVVNIDKKPVAAYRDENGMLNVFDATCPHLRCIVHWNRAQSTFDCPCHGSRFDTNGDVIEGPSLPGLTRFKEFD